MNISLSDETQQLLERQMKERGDSSPDEVIRAALETLESQTLDDLDPDTLSAIERAEAEIAQGEGIPLDEAFERLRRKHLGS